MPSSMVSAVRHHERRVRSMRDEHAQNPVRILHLRQSKPAHSFNVRALAERPHLESHAPTHTSTRRGTIAKRIVSAQTSTNGRSHPKRPKPLPLSERDGLLSELDTSTTLTGRVALPTHACTHSSRHVRAKWCVRRNRRPCQPPPLSERCDRFFDLGKSTTGTQRFTLPTHAPWRMRRPTWQPIPQPTSPPTISE